MVRLDKLKSNCGSLIQSIKEHTHLRGLLGSLKSNWRAQVRSSSTAFVLHLFLPAHIWFIICIQCSDVTASYKDEGYLLYGVSFQDAGCPHSMGPVPNIALRLWWRHPVTLLVHHNPWVHSACCSCGVWQPKRMEMYPQQEKSSMLAAGNFLGMLVRPFIFKNDISCFSQSALPWCSQIPSWCKTCQPAISIRFCGKR